MMLVEVCHRTECKAFSKLVMGTDHLGPLGEDASRKMLDLAVQSGINVFDTAPIYVNDVERVLGEWMKAKRTENPDIVLYTITKGGFPRDLAPGTYTSRLKKTKEDIITNINNEELVHSLPHSNHQINVYLMHRDDVDYRDYKRVPRPQTPVATILAALSDQRLRDSYTWIGLSNWETARVNKANSSVGPRQTFTPARDYEPIFFSL